MQILLMIQMGWYAFKGINLSTDAIRYIDPEWDYTAPGEPLYPSILYLLGFKEPSSASDQTDAESDD